MEVDDIQNQTQTPQQPCKYSRVNSNGRIDSSKIALGGGGGGASNGGTHNNEVVGPTTTTALATTTATRAMTVGGGGGLLGGEMVVGSNGSNSRFGRQWQHSSRIIRVSRASGGKDRHSKVWTAKGPRDRRVRLSVTTAIQFYDLQDRLGYDQPSKAVEWLIKAASEAINELPSLNTASFPPETPRQLSDERKSGGAGDSGDMELLADGEVNLGQQMGSKSGCSSNNSETSKGSGLSLSRSEIRVKARERARERTAKEKERDGEPSSSSMVNNVVASHKHKHSNNNQQHQHHHQQNVSSMAQTSSFTQLLTAGMTNVNENNNGGGASSSPSAEMGLFHKHSRPSGGGGGGNNNDNNNSTANDNQWLSSATSTTQMADYFGNGLMGLSASSRAGHIGLGSNTSSLPQVMTIASFGGGSENHHQSHHDQLQHHNPHHHHHHSQQQQPQPHFPFMSDQHLIQVANAASGANGGGAGGSGNEYNLSFSMSSTSSTSSALAAAGYNNRGTLQSNSPSLLPYLQRFSAATDGSSLPFFLGSAAVSSASPNVENHNHHHQQHHHQQQQHYQPPGLQLCYGDGGRQTDQKGKGKN